MFLLFQQCQITLEGQFRIFFLIDLPMNQKTLQMIYKNYEGNQFFKRYLVDLGCREDRRKIHEHRIVKITSRNNSVVISAGQTIIIAHIETQIQQVTFSPISLCYGEPLLKLQVTTSTTAQNKYRQNKADRAIQEFICKQINWGAIEDEIVGSDINTGKQYGYKGNIDVRVLGDDGGVEQYALLAVQLLLWTCKFKKFTINKQKVEYGQEYKLELHQFLFPLKYCSILDKILVDPSLSQEQHCDFVASVIKDLGDQSLPPLVLHHARKDHGKLNSVWLKQILGQWESQAAKLSLLFQRMLQELQEKKQFVLFEVEKA